MFFRFCLLYNIIMKSLCTMFVFYHVLSSDNDCHLPLWYLRMLLITYFFHSFMYSRYNLLEGANGMSNQIFINLKNFLFFCYSYFSTFYFWYNAVVRDLFSKRFNFEFPWDVGPCNCLRPDIDMTCLT